MSDISHIGGRITGGVLEFYDKASGRTVLALDTAVGPVQSAKFTATLAEINAGKTVVAADANRTLIPIGFYLHSTGAFAALTDIRLSDTAASPVDIVTITQAAATDGAVFVPGTISGMTLGAGFNAALTAGKGIQIRKTGSTGTTATSMEGTVLYTYA